MNTATNTLAPPERSVSHRRKTSLAQYLILRQQLSSPPQISPKMNRATPPRQGLAAAGRGQQQQPQKQPPQQDPYGQAQDGQDDQDPQAAGEDDEQNGQYGEQGDEQQDGQEGEEGQYGQEGAEGEEGQGEDEQQGDEQDEQNGEDDEQTPGKPGAKAAQGKKGAAGQLAKKKGAHVVKPEHAHSRFSQDPHHHTMMANFHNIACK